MHTNWRIPNLENLVEFCGTFQVVNTVAVVLSTLFLLACFQSLVLTQLSLPLVELPPHTHFIVLRFQPT
jgi:hypothetical protein